MLVVIIYRCHSVFFYSKYFSSTLVFSMWASNLGILLGTWTSCVQSKDLIIIVIFDVDSHVF